MSSEELQSASKYDLGNTNIETALQDGKITDSEWSLFLIMSKTLPRLTETLKDVASANQSFSQGAEKQIGLIAKACALKGGGRGDENYVHTNGTLDVSKMPDFLAAREKNDSAINREPEEIVLQHFVNNPDKVPAEGEKDQILTALGRIIEVDMTILSYSGKDEITQEPKDVSLFLTRIKNATATAKEIINRS